MQSHLRFQRETGRLTRDEEEAVMHEIRLQSGGPRAAGLARTASEKAKPQTLEDFHRQRAAAQKRQHSAAHLTRSVKEYSPHTRHSSLSDVAVRSASLPDMFDERSTTIHGKPSHHLYERDMTTHQIHRISRVLDDIEMQLTASHHHHDPSSQFSITQSHATERIEAHVTQLNRTLAQASLPALQDQRSPHSVSRSDEEHFDPARTQKQEASQRNVECATEQTDSHVWAPEYHRTTDLQHMSEHSPQGTAGHVKADSVASSVAPSSSYFFSPVAEESVSSVSSPGSSYHSDDESFLDMTDRTNFEEAADSYRREVDAQGDRDGAARFARQHWGGLDLDDIAFVQEALVRAASLASYDDPMRPTSKCTDGSLKSRRMRQPATKPGSLSSSRSHLDDVAETTDEDAAGGHDTLFHDSASQSPSASSHEVQSLRTPSAPVALMQRHDRLQETVSPSTSHVPRTDIWSANNHTTHSNNQIPSEEDMPERASASRAAISNPSYVPGRRFPLRTSSNTGASPISSVHRQVAAQASAATDALKQHPLGSTFAAASTSPRTKMTKSVKITDIGSPQLISTSANLSNDAVRDLVGVQSPSAALANKGRHVRNQSSTSAGFPARMVRTDSIGAKVPEDGLVRSESLNGSSAVSPRSMQVASSTLSSPSVSGHSLGSSAVSPAVEGGTTILSPTGLQRVLSKFRKAKAITPSSPSHGSNAQSPSRITPSMSPPLTAPASARALAVGLGLTNPADEGGGRSDHPVVPQHTLPSISGRMPLDPEVRPVAIQNADATQRGEQHTADLTASVSAAHQVADEPQPIVLRRTIIIPSNAHSAEAERTAPDPLRRSQTDRQRRTSASSSVRRHRKTSSGGGVSAHSTFSALADRPPTPPPGAASHRRRRSQDALFESMPTGLLPSTIARELRLADDGPENPLVHLTPHTPKSACSSPSAASFGGSILDYYDDDDRRHTSSHVLASGRIVPSEASKTSHKAFIPDVAISAAAASGAQVELDELEDGSYVWQVVQNLRTKRTSDVSSVVGLFHSRQSSAASSIARMRPKVIQSSPVPDSSSPLAVRPAGDAMKLMIRRERTNDHNETSPRPSMSSDHSVRIYEASSADVNALIDEITSKGAAGSLDLVRQRSLQRIIAQRRNPASPEMASTTF